MTGILAEASAGLKDVGAVGALKRWAPSSCPGEKYAVLSK